MLLGVAGKKRSGKDTVANYLVKNHQFRRIAFADVLKQVAEGIDPIIGGEHLMELLDWNGYDWEAAKEYPQVRRFIQNLGVAVRNVDPLFWVRNSGLLDVLPEYENVVVSDVRFPNEVDAILKQGGRVFRVVRSGLPDDNHLTETALDDYDLPMIKNAGSIDDLHREIEEVVDNGVD